MRIYVIVLRAWSPGGVGLSTRGHGTVPRNVTIVATVKTQMEVETSLTLDIRELTIRTQH